MALSSSQHVVEFLRRAREADEQDRLAAERWLGEGGRAPVEQRVLTPFARMPASRVRARRRVLIVGGGVAGLETLLALRALADDRVEITLVSGEPRFINRSMAVDQPFNPKRVRGLKLEAVAAEFGAEWIHASVDRVERDRHVVVTTDRDELPYDFLVLALGAHAEREWRSEGVLTYHDGRESRVRQTAALPPGMHRPWPGSSGIT